MPPLVSVIIPSRNYGRYLREAVDSVLAQGVDDIEVIVVDDGSTDDTPEVLRQVRDPRVSSSRLPGNGISAARNAGLERATGRYIAFLDADDRWLPGKLQRQLTLLEAEPEVAFVFTDFHRFDDEGRFPLTQFDFVPELATIPTRPSRDGGGLVLQADPFVSLVPAKQFPTWVQTCFLRHEVVRALRYDEHIPINEDQHYMLRVYTLGGAAYLPEPLVEVRRHDRNSYTSPLPKIEADARVLTLLLEEPLLPSHRAVLRRRSGRAWAAFGYYHFWNRSPRLAARGYLKSLRFPGSRLTSVAHLAAVSLVPFLPKRGQSGWIDGAHIRRGRTSAPESHSGGAPQQPTGEICRRSLHPAAVPPIVSVIIPSRNYGRYLRESVESALAQGIEEIEVIVVDDGSTDETPEVLRSIRDPRVVGIRLPGNGTSAARNAGLDRATGRFIAFLDADDRWLPGKLERQVALLDAEPEVAFVFTDLSRFGEAGRYPLTQFDFVPELSRIPTRLSRAGGGRVLEADPFASLVAAAQFPVWVQTCVLRHDVVRTVRFDERIGLNQDTHYVMRVFPLGRAAYLPEPLAEVRRHNRNSYTSPRPKLEADVRVLTLLLEEPLLPSHRAVLRRRVARAWAAVGYYHFWHRSPLKSAQAYFGALRYPGVRLGSVAHLLALPLVPFLSRQDEGWIDNIQRP